MPNPQTIIRDGSGTRTATYQLPPGLFQYIESILVELDNGAAVDVRPTLEVQTVNGQVMAAKRQGESIPAGDTGTATWALRLTDEVAATASGLTWLQGIGFTQVGGGTSVAAGATGLTQFDGIWQNNDEAIFKTGADFGGGPIGFLPQRDGMYGVWIASQWDVAAFDKMIGFQGPLTDGLFNGRNSNSLAVYAFFLLEGLSHFTTIACANKNNGAVAHNVTSSYMAAVYFGDA